MPNKLASETSPYLLQHADNPVDWYPWGTEALSRARNEDKPILLSIGYAACHWCHVMAHESFEDPEVARVMNEMFVNIKVDREERPDLDSIYMQAVQAMTGQGGWPMTMFLTPEGVPFYGGTYFPPADRHGIPSFTRILTTVAAAYRDQRGRVAETVDAMRRLYDDASAVHESSSRPDARTLEMSFRALSRSYDVGNGGFGGAPKFPPTMVLEFLLRYWSRTGNTDALRMAHDTFIRMARGGIYDQIAGGFARYSVDARWIVPHFEKMLYDNALLIRFGARLYRATRDPEVKRVTEQTIEWALRDLCSPEGAFYSSYDADSEGEEGRYYVWSSAELTTLLGDDAATAIQYYGVSGTGNFEGSNILLRPTADAVVAARAGVSEEDLEAVMTRVRSILLEARSTRVPPGRDDKIITSWNGLMVRALSEAAQAFGDQRYAQAAERCASFLFTLMTHTGTEAVEDRVLRVFRTFNRGEARISGFLEDYASLGLAAIAMYEITFDNIWLERARSLSQSCVRLFSAANDEGKHSAVQFFDTPLGGEKLITRPRDVSDNAMPSGSSLATELLLIVGEYYGDAAATGRAEAVMTTLTEAMQHYPAGFGHMLCATDTAVHGTIQLALVGQSDKDGSNLGAMRDALATLYFPVLIIAAGSGEDSQLPLLAGKTSSANTVTAYVCRRYLCDAPVTSAAALRAQMEKQLNPAANAAPASTVNNA